jgi:hypothetical protein
MISTTQIERKEKDIIRHSPFPPILHFPNGLLLKGVLGRDIKRKVPERTTDDQV